MAPSLLQATLNPEQAVYHVNAGKIQDSKLDMSISHVNSATAHFHMSVLRKFDEIYYCLEHDPSQDDHTKATSLQTFLVLAESRYFQYLNLLSDFAEKLSHEDKFANIMPLPPWDVAMVFHAHCLNPHSFTADLTMSFENLLRVGIEFPLERLHTLIKIGTNSDTQSQRQWDEYHLKCGHATALVPYQLSHDLPNALSDSWKTFGIYTSCSSCNTETVLGLSPFTTLRLGRKLLICPNCDASFDTTQLPTDLVSASLRQRSFAAKMASDMFSGLDSLPNLDKATSRYRKFMFVDMDLDSECGIVPTLDIDLIWHTHQLFPVEYRRWCLENLNRYVNHDDTIEESTLATGLNSTVDIWLEKYGEKYEIDYFSKPMDRVQADPPSTGYCEYSPLCWPGRTLSGHTCSNDDCHKLLIEKVQLLDCRYSCGKCSKADCHKPSK